MTLILSCATRDFVIQVSDRKLTRLLPNGTVEDVDLESNKAVVVCNTTVFGYTGLAELEGENTGTWVANVISEAKCVGALDSCQAIASKAAAALTAISCSNEAKRQAFVAVGWQTDRRWTATTPLVAFASNALGARGGWLPIAEREFTVRVHVLRRPRRFVFHDAGCRLSSALRADIEKTLRVAIKRKAGAGAVATLLASAIRSVAKTDPQVGRNLMVVCIPKAAVRQDPNEKFSVDLILQRAHQAGDLSLLSRQPRLSTMSFLTAPEGGTDTKDFSPHFVCGGIRMSNYHTVETHTTEG